MHDKQLDVRTVDQAAQAAVEAHVDDVFGFDAPEKQPSELDVAALSLARSASNLVGHWLDGQPLEVQEEWDRNGRVTLPTQRIDGKPLQMAATREPDNSIQVSLIRLHMANSGFIIKKDGETATLVCDQAYDEAEGLSLVKNAGTWLKKYAKEFDFYKDELLRTTPQFHKSLDTPSLPEIRRQARANRTRRLKVGACISAAVAAATLSVIGMKSYFSGRSVAFDNTHFLPDDVQPIAIGEQGKVAFGDDLDSEIITHAQEIKGGPGQETFSIDGHAQKKYFDEYNLDDDTGHLIRALKPAQLAAGHCLVVQLGAIPETTTIKLASINQGPTYNLGAELNRTSLTVCSTGNPVNIGEREIFFELDPEGVNNDQTPSR